MNESQRQAYLQTMGVQVYFPKLVLPGAKPSPEYNFDQPKVATAAEARSEIPAVSRNLPAGQDSIQGKGGKSSGGRNVGRARKAIQDLNPAETTEAKRAATTAIKAEAAGVTPTPTDPSIGKVAETELRFSLRYYRINQRLAVIDEIPHQDTNSQQSETGQLLKAILNALDADLGACDFSYDVFQWPPAAEIPMNIDSREVARNALQGFIRVHHDTDDFQNLLIFAGQINELLQGSSQAAAVTDFQPDASTYFVTLCDSLSSMLAYPLLKRDAWQQMQALRQRLAAVSADNNS